MPVYGTRGFSSIAAYILAATVLATSASAAPAGPPDCKGNPDQALGVSRTVEIDTTGGPLFGFITKQTHEKSFLAPKEVVLTFDDGPLPGVTKPILDTLDRFCTRATFFSVGQMALAYPEQVREILRRGHTVGTHTWSHPMNLRRLKGDQARDQIENGFAAVTLAAGQPIAPFFRFPGLNDSPGLLAHLESRDIATFTVDVVSNDSYIQDPSRLIERTLRQLEIEHGGIMLFHDIKPQTARALPTILAELKARGYRIVHMRAKAPVKADELAMAALRQRIAARNPEALRTLFAITDGRPAPAPSPTLTQSKAPSMAPVPVAQTVAVKADPAAALVPAPAEPAATPTTDYALHVPAPAERAKAPAASASAAATETAPEALERTANRRKRRDVVAIEQAIEANRKADGAMATPTQPSSRVVSAKPEAAVLPAPAAQLPHAGGVKQNGGEVITAIPRTASEVGTSTGRQLRIINSDKAAPVEAAAPAPTLIKPPAAAMTDAPVASPASTLATAKPSSDGRRGATSGGPAAPAPTSTAGVSLLEAPLLEAPSAAAMPAPALQPPIATGTVIEVVAGTYARPADTPADTVAPAATEKAGRFAAPEIVAGSYRAQPAPAVQPVADPNWPAKTRRASSKRDATKPRPRDAN